jgi:hypothetical protein
LHERATYLPIQQQERSIKIQATPTEEKYVTDFVDLAATVPELNNHTCELIEDEIIAQNEQRNKERVPDSRPATKLSALANSRFPVGARASSRATVPFAVGRPVSRTTAPSVAGRPRERVPWLD